MIIRTIRPDPKYFLFPMVFRLKNQVGRSENTFLPKIFFCRISKYFFFYVYIVITSIWFYTYATRSFLLVTVCRRAGKQSRFAALAISASNAEGHSGAACLAGGSSSSLTILNQKYQHPKDRLKPMSSSMNTFHIPRPDADTLGSTEVKKPSLFSSLSFGKT